MKLRFAALLSAAAWPLFAHAAPALPDPTDAAAPVPALAVPPALDGYRPYRDATEPRDGIRSSDGLRPSWQQLNRAVTTGPEMRDMPDTHETHETHKMPDMPGMHDMPDTHERQDMHGSSKATPAAEHEHGTHEKGGGQ